MIPFETLWELLEPKKEYEPVRKRCLLLWNTFTPEKQQAIYSTIRNRKKEHLFQIGNEPLLLGVIEFRVLVAQTDGRRRPRGRYGIRLTAVTAALSRLFFGFLGNRL